MTDEDKTGKIKRLNITSNNNIKNCKEAKA